MFITINLADDGAEQRIMVGQIIGWCSMRLTRQPDTERWGSKIDCGAISYVVAESPERIDMLVRAARASDLKLQATARDI